MSKSPFYVVQDFLSNKQCEELVDKHKINTPNVDVNGLPSKLERILQPNQGQELILSKFLLHIGEIERRFTCKYKGIEAPTIINYPENDKSPAEPLGCENAKFFRKKWIKSKDVDLTAIIWLKDFNDTPPLDLTFEIYGGKLEFPGYNFSLTPQRGTLVLYPAGPQFVSAISPVIVGSNYQIKINISVSSLEHGLWNYNPSDFFVPSGDFLTGWFNEFL